MLELRAPNLIGIVAARQLQLPRDEIAGIESESLRREVERALSKQQPRGRKRRRQRDLRDDEDAATAGLVRRDGVVLAPSSRIASYGSAFAALRAGNTPNSSAVASVTTHAKTTARASTPAASSDGISLALNGWTASKRRRPSAPSATPSAPPIDQSTPCCAAIWATRCNRVAPSVARTASSRRRSSNCTTESEPTFVHATSSNTSAPPKSAASVGPASSSAPLPHRLDDDTRCLSSGAALVLDAVLQRFELFHSARSLHVRGEPRDHVHAHIGNALVGCKRQPQDTPR